MPDAETVDRICAGVEAVRMRRLLEQMLGWLSAPGKRDREVVADWMGEAELLVNPPKREAPARALVELFEAVGEFDRAMLHPREGAKSKGEALGLIESKYKACKREGL